MASKQAFDLTNAIKMEIVGTQQSRFQQRAGTAVQPAAE
jgi:hypothetical protein